MDALLDTLLAGKRATPARRAIVEPRGAGGRTIARAALAMRIEALAAGFTRLGLRAGDAAVFAVRPGIWSIAALFGLLRAGANVIAVDPGVAASERGQLDRVSLLALAEEGLQQARTERRTRGFNP